MTEYQNVNKVVLADGSVLIDLTSDDVVEADVQLGKRFHLPDGSIGYGTNECDADTRDATVTADEMLDGKTAYKNGVEIVGTMPNRGGVTGVITTLDGQYSIQNGYHDGSGKVGIDSTEAAKLIAENIKSGITVLGVEGAYNGETVTAQSKSVAPTFSIQTILPDSGYDYLSQVTVAAITVTETDNAAGGKTITIGSA